MQYTLRNIPSDVDQALREQAAREGKSLTRMAIEVLRRGLGLAPLVSRHRDLSEVCGSWVEDEETEAALADQRRIDLDAWR